MRHLLIDQVIPLSLSHMGHVVLHAGAVVVDAAIEGVGSGVAFIGPAGAGKSTLTASLANAGCVLVADDALVVSARSAHVLATPAYPGVRIWPEVVAAIAGSGRPETESLPQVAAYTNKRRVDAGGRWRFADHPVTLRRVHLLDEHDEDGVLVERMPARDGLMALLSHAYVLDVLDRTRLEAQFARIFEASRSVEVRRLRYPRRLDRLDAVHAAILDDLRRP